MTVAEIVAFVSDPSGLTLSDLDTIAESVESAKVQASREYAKTFEIGDRVEVLAEDGSGTFFTNITRRNKATVSIQGANGENVVIEPGRVLRVVDPA